MESVEDQVLQERFPALARRARRESVDMTPSFTQFGAHRVYSGTRRFYQFQVWRHLSSDHGETKLLWDRAHPQRPRTLRTTSHPRWTKQL